MVGKADMSLYGLRQLIEWSIDHSCMDDEERDQTRRTWEKLWKQFCDQLVREYPDLVPKSLHQKL